MLEFIKGDPQNPTGNLIAYCNVLGPNPVEPDARYILCNIVVSFLDALEQNFPVVVFPPVGAHDSQELNALFSLRPDYDIIRIPDFEFPKGVSEGKYIEERLDDLNEQVVEYVELCKDSYEIRELEAGFPELDDLPIPESPRNREITDEEEALLRLEESLRRYQKPVFVNEVPQLIRYIQKTYPRYDVDNLKRVILQKGDPKLTHLYLEKFRAIYHEEYEKAAVIQDKIRSLENA